MTVRRSNLRVRVDDVGRVEIVDPGFAELPLLREIDSAFEVRSQGLPGFSHPSLAAVRARRVPIGIEAARALSDRALWDMHDECMRGLAKNRKERSDSTACSVSLLDIKALLAQRMLRRCNLCARQCNVDRTKGGLGTCRLGTEAYVAEHFVHIAEEAPINPSLVLNLHGCGLRCRFCQQHAILVPRARESDRLDAGLWQRLDLNGARSLSFVGGNPDESLPAILEFLSATPPDWRLPVVWNNHAYSTPEVLRLLDGVVDAYVPDLKYMHERCGKRLSGVANYPETATRAIHEMLRQGVPVFVRVLVLPGHVNCCHLPAMESLGGLYSFDNLFVSIRGQYSPDWKIGARDGELRRRPHASEIELVREHAAERDLRMMD
jgi:putative pyruvate formate lyase activating enzyme